MRDELFIVGVLGVGLTANYTAAQSELPVSSLSANFRRGLLKESIRTFA